MDQEILRLSINKMADGVVFCREIAFMSDHSAYWRVTNLDTHESPGWQQVPDWHDLGQIRALAANMVAKGWEAIWNPNYSLGSEFIRSASFS